MNRQNSVALLADYLEGASDSPTVEDIEKAVAREKLRRRVQWLSGGKPIVMPAVALGVIFVMVIQFVVGDK